MGNETRNTSSPSRLSSGEAMNDSIARSHEEHPLLESSSVPIEVEPQVGLGPKLEAALSEDEPNNNNQERRRKRKSRWGDDQTKVNLPGLTTTLPSNLSKQDQELYVVQLRLEEINRKLRTGDVVPPEHQRSPSPEPVYDSVGKRLNTREIRYRQKLENERHRLVEDMMKANPLFRPPVDYRRPTKSSEKVFIPAAERPDINFIGLLIGPRGNTLKKIESESGGKISIRGKGSHKEGKARTDPNAQMGENEELHCYISADSEEKVRKAVDMIRKIIQDALKTPEGENELKRQQLRELALLNGTLREDEINGCGNCGSMMHRTRDCTEKRNITVNQACYICKGLGHLARDCIVKNDPQFQQDMAERHAQMDDEYRSFLASFDESGTNKQKPATIHASHESGVNRIIEPRPASSTPPPWAVPNSQTPRVVPSVAPWHSAPIYTPVEPLATYEGYQNIAPWQAPTYGAWYPPPPPSS